MNILKRLFSRRQAATQIKMINLPWAGSFSAYGGDAYSNDIFRAGVDAIARNAAKLKGSHVVQYSENERRAGEAHLTRLLQVRPNPLMSSFDFLYKLATHLFLSNNSFALVYRDDAGHVAGFYPITAQGVQMLEDGAGELFVSFNFSDGKQRIFPYRDVIHLRRHFNRGELLGDSNAAIIPALEAAQAENVGITAGIRAGAAIRGILKSEQILAPNLLREMKDSFVADYLSLENGSGIVAIDQKASFVPLEHRPTLLDAEQSAAIRAKIFSYLGISQKIVDSSYSEDEFAAFYESVIEPFALALGLEFTAKLFTEREQAFGNHVIFESGRLQFVNNKTKVELIKELVPLGLLTVNQALEVLNLPSVPDGDRRLQTLNVVDAARANAYQLGEVANDEGA